jgi:hypothetical protein
MKNDAVCGFREHSEGKRPGHPTEGLTTEIGVPIILSGSIPCVERTGSNDPLVNSLIQLHQLSKEIHQGQEPEQLKRERSIGVSHVDDGGGDTPQLMEEALRGYANP